MPRPQVPRNHNTFRHTEADRVAATKERKREKFANQATAAYTKALKLLWKATELDANLHQAWNYVGYCERKLGNCDAALLAYELPFALNPDYGEVVEYRGQAYLRLNRIEEAKGAYIQLYVGAPALRPAARVRGSARTRV